MSAALIHIEPRSPGHPAYPLGVDEICPFLALQADRRTVVAGYDPGHACHAEGTPVGMDRAAQSTTCLTEAHLECERYLTALQRHAAHAPLVPPPAPDSLISRTRLILDPGAMRKLPVSGPGFAPRRRRWAIGGVLALGVTAVAAGAAGALGGLGERSEETPEASSSGLGPLASEPALRSPAAASASPIPPSQEAAAPSVAPTPPATPAPTPAPTAVPTAQVRNYVVQAGDTLSLIATRFGTSVQAIQQANGLGGSDVISIGQVLVIP